MSKVKRNRRATIIETWRDPATGTIPCRWCGGALAEDEITLDHLTPLRLGGTNHIKNLVPSCAGCNQEKGGLSLDHWLRLRAQRFISGARQSVRRSFAQLAGIKREVRRGRDA